MINLHITDEQAQRFIEVYKEEYGEDLTIPEAIAVMQDVLPLIDLLLQPLPKAAVKEAHHEESQEATAA